jgi:hypothetical protein
VNYKIGFAVRKLALFQLWAWVVGVAFYGLDLPYKGTSFPKGSNTLPNFNWWGWGCFNWWATLKLWLFKTVAL